MESRVNGKKVKQYKDGEKIYDDLNYLQRSLIGDETAQELKDAETIEDIKKWLGRVFDVDLTETNEGGN